MLDVSDAVSAAKAVVHDFDVRRRYFESFMTFAKRCLSLIFLNIILNAQKYHDGYLTDIEFDNIYVTRYFRKIDARRKSRGSVTLLPLKKSERIKFVDPYGLRMSKIERRHIIGETLKLIFEMIIATSFILLDRLFYEALDLIRRHSRMDYTQVGLLMYDIFFFFQTILILFFSIHLILSVYQIYPSIYLSVCLSIHLLANVYTYFIFIFRLFYF